MDGWMDGRKLLQNVLAKSTNSTAILPGLNSTNRVVPVKLLSLSVPPAWQ